MMRNDPNKIIVALDFAHAQNLLNFIPLLDPALCRVKIGKELFTAAGPKIVEKVMQQGFEVFLDLKFHDIPHTVAGACRSAAALGVWMMNVHALGGRAMLEAAANALAALQSPPLLIAVTVLTSIDTLQLQELGLPTVDILVMQLAGLAQQSGLDGVVCSAQEASMLNTVYGTDFLSVTPGIRLPGNSADDQSRIMTPKAAIAAGADYLVIGRPITQSIDPRQALIDISSQIGQR